MPDPISDEHKTIMGVLLSPASTIKAIKNALKEYDDNGVRVEQTPEQKLQAKKDAMKKMLVTDSVAKQAAAIVMPQNNA